eukprot:352865-Chlamydomonas_euryale.AAC.2
MAVSAPRASSLDMASSTSCVGEHAADARHGLPTLALSTGTGLPVEAHGLGMQHGVDERLLS